MLRAHPSLDWQILDKEGDWNAVTETLPRHAGRPVVYGGRFALLAVVSLSALLIVAGGLLYRRADHSLARIQTELDEVIAVENWTKQHHDSDVLDAWIDPNAPKFWMTTVRANRLEPYTEPISLTSTIQDFQLCGDWAMLRVRVDEPDAIWQTAPYLETRFYRLTETGWLRTAPRTEFWGKMTGGETAFVEFTFRQRDAHVVREVMADIDEEYLDLRAYFGLDPVPAGEMLHVSVQPMGIPGDEMGLFHFYDNQLTVPSPLQFPTPEGLSDADVLRASILGPLAVFVLDQRMIEDQNPSSWQPLRDGIGLWLRQEYAAVPSTYQIELNRVLESWPHTEMLQLSHLATYSTPCPGCSSDDGYDKLRKAAARTLVSHAMMTYGRASLPSLIEAVGEHDTWEDLIAAAFGVPAQEFEKGWQTYLAGEYQ